VSSYGTPRSNRTPRVLQPEDEEFLALKVPKEDLAFAEKCRRQQQLSERVKEAFSFARHGDRSGLSKTLDEGVDANAQDDHGNTLFIVACQNGHKKIGKLLNERGADLNMQNSRGNTGLHFLFAYGYTEIAEYFISKGANPELKNELGLNCRRGIQFIT
jgi:ankyrin repeat protein